jgi:hypothetical protein
MFKQPSWAAQVIPSVQDAAMHLAAYARFGGNIAIIDPDLPVVVAVIE